MGKSTATMKNARQSPAAKSARGQSRREAILTEAARLFHHNGFHETGIDDIGAAVGITGPGVYRHFDSKQDLLAAILDRNIGQHQEIVDEVNALDLSPKDALRKLVERSAHELARNRDAAALYFQEARNLAPAELQRFTKVQRGLITEWVRILRAVRPELSEEDARVAVRGVAGLLNSVGYFTTTMSSEQLGESLAGMAMAALLEAPASC
jgi:AcrR family transcriptional regulator